MVLTGALARTQPAGAANPPAPAPVAASAPTTAPAPFLDRLAAEGATIPAALPANQLATPPPATNFAGHRPDGATGDRPGAGPGGFRHHQRRAS
ncbi:MAG: hypothetical protein R2746_12855 [Acidimicrobiales bacterium]